jgi:hypothetical protein
MRGIEKAPQVPFSDQLPRVLHDLLGAVAAMPTISSTPRRQAAERLWWVLTEGLNGSKPGKTC